MKYQKRPPLTSREIQILILIGVVTIAVLGTLIGADLRLSHGLRGGGGFFAPWEGARSFLFSHADPHGSAVAARIQEDVYGRRAQAGENPYILNIPFFLLPLYFPFALLPDPATARGLWMFVNEVALVGIAFMTVRLIEWQPSRFFHAAFAVLSVFSLYSVVALVDGGPGILLGLLYIAIVSTYYNGWDELTGALLVLSLFAWEIGLLFVVLMLWKIFQERRWRILAGFLMVFLILVGLSLLIYPGWIFPFVISTLAALRASFGTTSFSVLMRLSPEYGEHASQALTVLLIILVLYEWAATRGEDMRRLIWAACLTLAVTPLLGFRTDLSNLVVLFPSLALIFAATASRWRGGYWLASLLWLIAFLMPWALFVRWYWLHEQRSYDYLFLFAPVFTVVGLYWTRWWFLRPPRTWFDHVRSTLHPERPASNSRQSPGSIG